MAFAISMIAFDNSTVTALAITVFVHPHLRREKPLRQEWLHSLTSQPVYTHALIIYSRPNLKLHTKGLPFSQLFLLAHGWWFSSRMVNKSIELRKLYVNGLHFWLLRKRSFAYRLSRQQSIFQFDLKQMKRSWLLNSYGHPWHDEITGFCGDINIIFSEVSWCMLIPKLTLKAYE